MAVYWLTFSTTLLRRLLVIQMGGEVNRIDSMSAWVRPFTSSVSLASLAVWWIASLNKVRSLLSSVVSWNNTWANQCALEAVCFCLRWHLAHSIKACSGLGSTFSLHLQQDRKEATWFTPIISPLTVVLSRARRTSWSCGADLNVEPYFAFLRQISIHGSSYPQ